MPVLRSSAIAVPADASIDLPSVASPGAAAVASRLAGIRAWLLLGGIVLGSFAARLAAAVAHPSPQYFQDEYVYSALARSIAHGRLTIRGGSAGFPALLEPLLAAAAWLPDDPAVAYRLTQGLHALVMSLAAVPVFLLARRLAVPSRDALLAAAATVALPSFVFSAYLTADALGLTVALFAVLAGVAALERPTARAQALFLGLAAASTLTRLQYAFLPVAFLLAAVVVERGRPGALVRAFRPTLVALGAAAVLAAAVGPARLVGVYRGIFDFEAGVGGVAHWVVVDAFLLALATGVVVAPGAIVGLGGALRPAAGRAERGFASLALASILALLVEAAVFSANLEPRFIERYLIVAGPLLVLGLCLVTRPAHGRTMAIAVAAALLLAVLRFPLSGYAYGFGKRDSPFLSAVHWAQGRLGTGNGGLAIATVAALLILCSILALWLSPSAVSICLATAIAVGAAVSLAATSHDVTRAAAARTTFLPDDMRWVDHARLGPTTMLVPAGTNPPVASTHLFWNTSLERVALLNGAERVDAFRASRVAIAADGTLLAGGAPLTGPVLVEEYAASAQLEDARLVTRNDSTSLWLPRSRARLALLTEGRYLDGWLGYRTTIRSWPGGGGGAETLRLTLSLPQGTSAQRVTLTGGGVDRTVAVRPGVGQEIVLEVDRSRSSTLTIRCGRALQLPDNRLVCAKASVPELAPTNGALPSNPV